MDKPLHTLSLTEVLKGIESRRFTCEAYTQGLLSEDCRAGRGNPGLGLPGTCEGDRGGPPFR